MADKTDKRNKFHHLQQKYITQLPDKLAAIHAHWTAFRNRKEDSAGHFVELKRLVHSLAGSAGTFHFYRLSEEASTTEGLLAKIKGRIVTDAQLEHLDNVFEYLRILADKGPETILPESSGGEPLPSRPAHLIYVVEDDQALAEEITRQLHFFGYQVRAFHDSTQALEAMKQALPATMIVDLVLPEGDLAGAKLAQRFQALAEEQIPLIFISVRDDWDARLAAVRGGCHSYLVKPIDFSELQDHLDLLTRVDKRDPYRILIVDDMEVLAEHYALVLSEAGMRAEVVTRPANLFEPLQNFRPELVLMDLNMPGCSGIEAAKVIRQKEEFTGVPIVYLSTESNPERQLDAMSLGGDDFLHKPIGDEDLIAAVSIRAERFRKIRTLMNRDSLTGLLNHATLKTYLDNEVARAKRNRIPLSFAIVDIDRFKSVNDTYGHTMGDRVIKSIARLFSQRLRKSDLTGRYGGEEFAVILPDTPQEAAVELINELRGQFSEIIHVHQGTRFSCTFSAGVSTLHPHCSAEELIQRADEALYLAKHGGRNRVETKNS